MQPTIVDSQAFEVRARAAGDTGWGGACGRRRAGCDGGCTLVSSVALSACVGVTCVRAVDARAPQEWKEEAMQLWRSGWANIYPAASSARKVIDTIASTYWHVYMVDNNFIDGDIFRVFSQLLSLDPHAGSPVIRPQKPPP